MHHTIAYSESQDLAGVLGFVAAVPDQSVRVIGDGIVIPTGMDKLIGAMACIGTLGTRAQFVSPSLRRVNPYCINPLVLALMASGADSVLLHPRDPLPLAADEIMECQIVANPAAAEQESVVAFLAPGALEKVSGVIRPIRFTVTVTMLAGVWVNAAIDFVDELPTGVYRVVGASLVAAAGIVARFVPVGGAWRPGFPINQLESNPITGKFRGGNLGEWFVFNQNNPPTIDILASAAPGAGTFDGVMDVIAP